mmetsp:Transcript_7116/g.17684  ORF Transcript_7116/g.17684 Transcript_7116/m.17684 type:complete len:213 (+) Transcript_7116:223-861(+)
MWRRTRNQPSSASPGRLGASPAQDSEEDVPPTLACAGAIDRAGVRARQHLPTLLHWLRLCAAGDLLVYLLGGDISLPELEVQDAANELALDLGLVLGELLLWLLLRRLLILLGLLGLVLGPELGLLLLAARRGGLIRRRCRRRCLAQRKERLAGILALGGGRLEVAAASVHEREHGPLQAGGETRMHQRGHRRLLSAMSRGALPHGGEARHV